MSKSILLFLISIFIIHAAHAQQLTIATYNMRYANAGDSANGNGWGQRLPIITNLILFHDWDMFGTQECKYNQILDLTSHLTEYAYTGIGRDDGEKAGEFSAVFYKKKKYKLLQNHTFWLSVDTSQPNKGWDAALPRICSWGKFQEIATGFMFYFFNLHMDHIGVTARRESAKLVMRKIKETAGNTPAILTGDFNVDQNNESYTLINTSGLLKDAFELSPVKLATNGTFNNFDIRNKTNSRIDHIFLSRNFMVKRYAIVTDAYWSASASPDSIKAGKFPKEDAALQLTPRLPSDHYPVMAVVEYK